jgi:uncharacterized protein YegL
MYRINPVYFLLQTSGYGDSRHVDKALKCMRDTIAYLYGNPFALDSFWCCLITYGSNPEVTVPMVPLEEFSMPMSAIQNLGDPDMGVAIRLVHKTQAEFVASRIGFNRISPPSIVFIGDGYSVPRFSANILQANGRKAPRCIVFSTASTLHLQYLELQSQHAPTECFCANCADYGATYAWIPDPAPEKAANLDYLAPLGSVGAMVAVDASCLKRA